MQAIASQPINYWPDDACARAFWGQQELPPYKRLLKHTVAWLDPGPREEWLDLGCGGGQLTRGLWMKSRGALARIVSADCAAVNERAIRKLQTSLQPRPAGDQLSFVCLDFSHGLPVWENESFDGVVSGLAIQYAQCYCDVRGCWTTDAYDHLLTEVWRVLRAGGRFTFSVNVPEPDWIKVALSSLPDIFRTRQTGRFLKDSWRMLRYGAWLSREARRGRFHYLPIPVLSQKLRAAGFCSIEHRLSYAGQAYLIRCHKPGQKK
jgi:SAM-dependent methyltransferase